ALDRPVAQAVSGGGRRGSSAEVDISATAIASTPTRAARRRTRSMRKASPIVLLAVVLLAAIPAAIAWRPAVARAAGNTLTVAFSTDIVTLDPHQNTDLNTMQVLLQIYEHLVALGRDGKYHGVLAESWEVVDDRTWRFKLRRGVRFHNGEE